MRFGRISANFCAIDSDSPLVRMWIATLLSDPKLWADARGGYRPRNEFEATELLALFNLNRSDIRRRSKPPQSLAERARAYARQDPWSQEPICRNIQRLGERLDLTAAEQRLLIFTIAMQSCVELCQAAELVKHSGRKRITHLLASILQVSVSGVEKALHPDSTICKAGLIDVDFSGHHCDLSNWLTVNDELLAFVTVPDSSESEMLRLFYRTSEPSELTMDDFIHIKEDIEIIQRLLTDALAHRRKGINVLVYGVPGTGKTELTKCLATSLNASLAIVADTAPDGEDIPPEQRLGRLNCCLKALSQKQDSLVMFDEAEDLFRSTETQFFREKKTLSKSILTRMLEENPHPVTWISNSIDMDPALLRRFKYILHLDVPSPAHRQRILNRYLHDLPISDGCRQAIIDNKSLSPAIVSSASEVARTSLEHGSESACEHSFVRTLEAYLEATDQPPLIKKTTDQILPWRKQVINADTDVAQLLDTLEPNVPARLCLYGPPGTGKTAWARQLAEKLQQPLIVKQATDLTSPFIGMTERYIAAAFREAEREGAVLLIDEADSFLDDRSHAIRSWEVSEVNQFLTSMENYQGIFIATTNFMTRMDIAAMRRFDFRIRFDYMALQGVKTMLGDLAQIYDIHLPAEPTLTDMLLGLNKLTPGDFAAIARRLRVSKIKPDAEGLVALLKAEISYKPDTQRAIGFLADAG